MSSSNNSLAMQRIVKLLDENSFMEVGSLVTARSTDFNLSNTDTPSDGVIIGHGLIGGSLVFIYSQDASVLNGTIGEMHAKKIASVYDMAMKMGAPVIGFLDCAGIRLQESVDALNGLGQIYLKEAEASGVIPQISAVFGTCGGGLTAVPAMCDFNFIESSKGRMFVNAPNTIPGNRADKCDTSAAEYQSKETGYVDGVGTEDEILSSIRDLISVLPDNNGTGGLTEPCEDDLNRACENLSGMKGDPRYVFSEIADDHVFVETKKDYAKDITVGAGAGALAGVIISPLAGGDMGKGTALATAVGAGGGLVKSIWDKGEDVQIPTNAAVDLILTQPITVAPVSIEDKSYGQ